LQGELRGFFGDMWGLGKEGKKNQVVNPGEVFGQIAKV